MSATASIDNLSQLEELLSRPTERVVEQFGQRDGDVILLGAGGKMGGSLARMAQRACQLAGARRRVYAVSRFTEADKQADLEACGIETIRCDLLDEDAFRELPQAADVIHMAGLKFGTTGQEARMWAMNAHLAGEVCRKYRRSRILFFSTGNVYGLAPVANGGSRESDAPRPLGEYAMSCLGRERIFEHFSRALGIPMVAIRLNYACEPRYGVLVDLARRVMAGEVVDLEMGHFNTIWQGDANAMSLLAFSKAATPAFVLNVTGPELLSVRQICLQFGSLFGREVRFRGEEAPLSIVSNASQTFQLFGPPAVAADQLVHWVADWLKHGGSTLDHPTRFEVRDGKF